MAIELKFTADHVYELRDILESLLAKANEPVAVSAEAPAPAVSTVEVKRPGRPKKEEAKAIATEVKSAITEAIEENKKPEVIEEPVNTDEGIAPISYAELNAYVIGIAGRIKAKDEATFIKFSGELTGEVYKNHRIRVLGDAVNLNDTERGKFKMDVDALVKKYGV